MELSYVTQLAVLALIVGTVTPVPVNLNLFKDDKTCAKRCFAIKTVHYEVGTIYSYSYSATAKTLIAGASKDSAFVKIDADVDIVSTSPCDFVMKLKNTKMSDSEKTARGQKSAERQRMVQFSDALEVHMLRFSSQGGRIEDVCPDMDEPAWVLNIKRGILSTLQSSMEGFKHNQTFVETDTNGDCPTSYTATTTSSAYKVTKTKDLSQCLRRQEYDSAIQSIGYSLESGIQSLPILKSRSVCHQSIDRREGHLLVSECSETNTFRPFSSGDNGASNVNSQTLRFTRKSSSGKPSVGYIDYRTDLTYHHHNDHQKQQQQQQQTSIKDVQAHLRTVCQQVQGDVRPETPSGVYKLVKLMRRVDTATLDSLYADIESGSLCPTKGKKNELREVFLDVLPMLGTGPAVDFMVTKVTSGAVSNARQTLWQLSFPYIAKPTRQMLVSMKKLLDSDYHNDHTLLLVSSVVGHYCHDNPQCSEEEVVKGIVGIIESLIGDCRWDEMNRPN
ncbi:vitellogenin-like, partial [Argonauta hians]